MGTMKQRNDSSILPSAGMLCSIGWLRADVLGLPFSPIFMVQVFKKKTMGLKSSII